MKELNVIQKQKVAGGEADKDRYAQGPIGAFSVALYGIGTCSIIEVFKLPERAILEY